MLKKEDGLSCVFPYIQKSPLYYTRTFLFSIEGKTYYFKKTKNILQELIVCEIYKMLGIPCVEYELVKLWNQYYLMSPSFRKEDCNYISGYALLSEYLSKYLNSKNSNIEKEMGINPIDGVYGANNLENIWMALAQKNYNIEDIRKFMIDLIKVYSMQIILLDDDFHYYNWEIEIDKNNRPSLAPKYDNERCFNNGYSEILMGMDAEDTFVDFGISLKRFLNYSDAEDAQIFYDLFNACDVNMIRKAISNIKEKYPKHYDLFDKTMSEEKIIEKFEQHNNELQKIVNETKVRR